MSNSYWVVFLKRPVVKAQMSVRIQLDICPPEVAFVMRGITKRYIHFFYIILIFLRKKWFFFAVFLLFTAAVRSRPPGPPLVPELFNISKFVKSTPGQTTPLIYLGPISKFPWLWFIFSRQNQKQYVLFSSPLIYQDICGKAGWAISEKKDKEKIIRKIPKK